MTRRFEVNAYGEAGLSHERQKGAEESGHVFEANTNVGQQDGHLRSRYSISETLQRVESLLRERGLTIFCRVDHCGEAEKAGIKMRPTELMLFGSPKGGTPVMIASPTIAIYLPLEALIWEDAEGKVWVSFNSPEYLQQRHNVPADLVKNISGAEPVLQTAVE